MKLAEKLRQKENCIWSLGISVLLCTVISMFFDYYYDLNDDVLMKDILAGVYTGTPEGNNIQMLFPISFLISLFYRVARVVPWYGVFFSICHFGSIYLITNRLLTFFESRLTKLVAVFLESGIVVTLLLKDLVFVQYTITCTLLASSAVFLFYTADSHVPTKQFFKKNIPSILLVTLAYCIRSEMLLLVLPLICVTGLCKWAGEKPFFTKANAAKYFSVFGGIMAGIVLSQGIHMVANSGEDWKQFTTFFDNRTELYDFQTIPPYEGNEAFYESIGMTESEQALLINYNFGLQEEIDAECMGRIADYAAGLKKDRVSFTENLKIALSEYKYRTFYDTDYPWNLFVITMYGLVLVAAVMNKRFRFIWELACLGIVRSGLWLFILYRGRAPERITHSLYWMELVILLALLVKECKTKTGIFSLLKVMVAGVMLLVCIWRLDNSITATNTEYARREEVNKELQALQAYAREHDDNFYFFDVYSSVKYSEKLFANVDNSLSNYDIMGGWASKSPLMEKKYAQFGIETMEQALLEQDNVFVIVRIEEPDTLPYVKDWLPQYYADQGVMVQLQKVDSIAINEKEIFAIYAVNEVQ
ncbi:MAG: hypothetical protein IJ405_09400 [Lachnospiraceae bacterium]|nr:hypothetical protein [Lachnospiraceae bacterium]